MQVQSPSNTQQSTIAIPIITQTKIEIQKEEFTELVVNCLEFIVGYNDKIVNAKNEKSRTKQLEIELFTELRRDLSAQLAVHPQTYLAISDLILGKSIRPEEAVREKIESTLVQESNLKSILDLSFFVNNGGEAAMIENDHKDMTTTNVNVIDDKESTDVDGGDDVEEVGNDEVNAMERVLKTSSSRGISSRSDFTDRVDDEDDDENENYGDNDADNGGDDDNDEDNDDGDDNDDDDEGM